LRTRGGLAAGQLISTGTCTGLFKAEPGAKAQAWFNNKQAVALNFV
jgi:2-keto-4-pentenoate hydratase